MCIPAEESSFLVLMTPKQSNNVPDCLILNLAEFQLEAFCDDLHQLCNRSQDGPKAHNNYVNDYEQLMKGSMIWSKEHMNAPDYSSQYHNQVSPKCALSP